MVQFGAPWDAGENHRLRRYNIGTHTVAALLLSNRIDQDTVVMPRSVLPQGATVLYMGHSWETNSIAIIATHPSFDEVPLGMNIPTDPTTWDRELYRVIKKNTLIEFKDFTTEELQELKDDISTVIRDREKGENQFNA